MELFRRLFAKQPAAVDHGTRITQLIEQHVPDRRLAFEDCAWVGAEVLTQVLVEATNAAAADARRRPTAPAGLGDDLGPAIDRTTTAAITTGVDGLRYIAVLRQVPASAAVAFLVMTHCLEAPDPSAGALDPHGVERFVTGLYGVALELARRAPDLARWLVDFDAATQQRSQAELSYADETVRRGGQLPAVSGRGDAAATPADVGLAAVAGLHQNLRIDEAWTTWHARGFTWLPYRLRQTVAASPVFESEDVRVAVVEGCTPVVENVQAPAEEVDRLLAALNLTAIGSALVFWPAERRIVSVLAQVVHQATLADRIRQLGCFLILQVSEAERIAGELAQQVRGDVAFAAHPEYGARTTPDEMCNVVRDIFGPRGAGASDFAVAAEFEAVVRLVQETPFASVGASAGGVCVEVPFNANGTTLIELSSGQRHPILGAGLAVRTSVPISGTVEQAAALAALLGRAQFDTIEGGAYLGAWGLRVEGERAYAAWMRFVPNADFRPRYVLDVAMGEIARAQWVDRLFCPELEPRSAWPIMYARMTGEGRK